jgi:anti-sigma B factor antagonist
MVKAETAWTLAIGDDGVVRLIGEVDFAEANALFDLLVTQLEQTPVLSLDMGAVSFIDSTVLSVLLQIHERAAAARGGLRLVDPSGPVGRILAVAGLAEFFTATSMPAGQPTAAA